MGSGAYGFYLYSSSSNNKLFNQFDYTVTFPSSDVDLTYSETNNGMSQYEYVCITSPIPSFPLVFNIGTASSDLSA